jgi:hypothetical protein
MDKKCAMRAVAMGRVCGAVAKDTRSRCKRWCSAPAVTTNTKTRRYAPIVGGTPWILYMLMCLFCILGLFTHQGMFSFNEYSIMLTMSVYYHDTILCMFSVKPVLPVSSVNSLIVKVGLP